MNILSINNLAKIGREAPLFTDVTFGMDAGDKAAVIGRNGTGKSTLLATIAGALTPDEGTVVLNKSAGVSYLSQNPAFNPENTIREHIFASHSPKLEKIREYEEICDQMADESEKNTISARLQQRFDQLTLEMDKGDLWNYEAQVRSILSTLGITDMARKMGTLSGGMVKKVALAQVLVEDTQLLLLDEPTNHLDITTIYWLQNYLHDTQRTVLMVTHDRYFLDAVCTNIYELARGHLKLYQGNYSTYLEKKEVEAEIEANTERRIESVLRFERDWLLRGPCARGTKAKARIQRDMQLINREKFAADKGFTFEVAGRRLGGKILELHNISKNYPKGYVGESLPPASHSVAPTPPSAGDTPATPPCFTPVLKNFSYTFSKGEKIGIFGDNGSGKSTLLNLITGTIQPDSGTIVTGVNTVFGYYQQNPVFTDLSLTVLEYIKEAAEVIQMNDGKTLSAAQFLNEFGFEGKIQHSALSTLSGGERKRVFLVRLLISNPNFLILDEPTNDFDIFTMNLLEDFLLGYKGCLLIVSHDRYFMDKIADTLFILEEDGNVSGFVGKCSEYLDYREEQKSNIQKDASNRKDKNIKENPVQPDSSVASSLVADSSTAESPKPRKLSFKEQREFDQLEAEIETLEARKTELEAAMSDPDYTKAQAAGTEYAKISAQLESDYARWEELAI
ncbi:MAG: ABC-F family ATP-binding cassette domain-containing protein [Treponema sp.]|nr:ABC-F family ATP-binding cassette domain-containing protein [Treponema sp.]